MKQYKSGNLDQCALISVNTHTQGKKQVFTLQEVSFLLVFLIKLGYITSEMAHTFFFFQKACAFFFPSLCSSDTPSVKGG